MNILTVTKQKYIADTIHSEMALIRPDVHVESCTNLDELESRLLKNTRGQSCDVIFVDIASGPEAAFTKLKKIVDANQKSQFVVLSDEFSQDLMLRAMHAGVWHFIHKKQLTVELGVTMAKILFSKVKQGRMISVLSCSGGCGTTTIANNLASEFSLCSDSQSLIVDLDLSYGAASRHLGLNGSYGIDHILSREGLIDGHLIESVAVKASDGVSVMLSPASKMTDNEEQYTFDRLGDTLNACKEVYRNVVIDASRVSNTVLKDLAAASDAMVVVFQMKVADLHFAQSIISRFREYGMAPERIIPVANRVRKLSLLLDIKDARKTLQPSVVHKLRNDWSIAMKSINEEKTLCSMAKRSGLRRDFLDLVNRIEKLSVYVPHLSSMACSTKAAPGLMRV